MPVSTSTSFLKELEVAQPWETTGTIGTIVPGEISELYVKGRFSTSTLYTSYSIVNGSLPSGLTLYRDGTIGGRVDVNTGTTTATSTSSFIEQLMTPIIITY